MAKTDWTMVDEVKPSDMNQIGTEINELRDDINNIPAASTTVAGITKLNNSTTSSSEADAATPKAVNDARVAAATDATTKANTAETNAKNYANTNFRKPSEMLQANIIKNSTAAQGVNYWNAVSGPWNAYLNQYVGSYFAISGIAVSDVDYLLLENEAVGVSPGAQYLLQAVLHSGGSYANSRIYVEMYNPATGAPIDSVQADNQKWWHRKTKIVTIPAGVSAIKLRLVVNNVPANMTAGFSRIMLTEGTLDVPYSQEMDIRALYEQNEAVKQSGVDAKNGVVGAINAKGGSASTSDTWAQLAAKINSIQTGNLSPGSRIILGPYGSSTTSTSQTLFKGIKFNKPGTYRVFYNFGPFELGTTPAYTRILIDGVEFMPTVSTTSGTSISRDIPVQADQEIQIYYWVANSANRAQISSFTVGIDLVITER